MTGTGGNAYFGSAGIQASTSPNVTMRNNIVVNKVTPGASGFTAAYRRTSSTLTSYNAASNNNLFSIGTPSANNLVYYDGTNSAQTLAAYQTLVTPRDANSVSQDLTSLWLSTTCGTSNLLHISPSIPTLIESGGVTISGITTDFDGDTRNASTPDIGADEGAFTNLAPAITSATASPATGQCSAVLHTVTATVVPGGAAIISVTLNYSYDGVPQTPIAMTNVSGNDWTADIPAATPTNAMVTWSVTATDGTYNPSGTGAPYQDDYLNGIPVTASASSTLLCEGEDVTLTASATTPANGQIGTATTTTSAYPYYRLYGSAKTQMMYLASELTAAGLTAGNIYSIGFNITLTGGTIPNFSVSMKNTTNSTLTALETGLTVVNTTATFTPVLGVNMHTFSTPFYWDGTSNIIVEVCFANADAGAGSSTVTYSNPGFAAVYKYYQDNNTTMCTTPAGSTSPSSTVRPNLYINGSSNGIGLYTSNWYEGATNIGTGSSITVTSPVAGSHDYYVSISDGNGCSVSSSPVTVNVNPLPGAPTATNSTQCGYGVPTCSVSGSGGNFHWYDASTGGTLIQDDVSSTLLSYAIGTSTSFYVSEFDGSCESPRTQVDALVSNGDTISASASVANTCAFVDFDLTATDISLPQNNTYTYTWTASPSAGSGIPTSVSGNPVTIQATAGGTYTYTVTGYDATAMCTSISTVTVTVADPPTTPLPTSVPSTICAGETVQMHANTYTSGSGSVSTGLAGGNGSQTNFFDIDNVSGADVTIHFFSANVASGTIANIYYKPSPLVSCTTSPVIGDFTNIGVNIPITVTAPPTLIPFDANITIPAGQTYSFVVDITGGSLTYSNGVGGCPIVASDANIAIHEGFGGTTTGTIASRIFNGVVSYSYLVGDPNLAYAWTPNTEITAGEDVIQDPTATPTTTTDFTVTVTDLSGCTNSGTVTVTVNAVPAAPTATNGSHCGYGLPTCSVVGTGGNLRWYDAPTGGTLIQDDGSTTLLSYYTSTSTSFWVSEFDGNCEGPRVQVDETVAATDGIDATASSAAVCIGGTVDLTATNTGGGTGQSYTYEWSATDPNSGISTPVSGSPVTITPLATGTYIYTVTGTDGGCTNFATVSVDVVNPPVITSATASPNPACEGSDVTLTAVTGTTGPQLATFGTGALINGTSETSPNYPPFGQYWTGSRHQMLVLASELNAAGITAGNIYSIAFNVSAVAGNPLNDWHVLVGSTAQTDLTTTFISGLTDVYNTATYTPVAGWNTFTFTSPYYWDGTSNLVIGTYTSNCTSCTGGNVCSGTSYSSNCQTYMTNTAFNSHAYYYSDGNSCNLPTITTASYVQVSRPDMQINGTHSTVGAGSYTWQWDPGALSGNEVTVNPTSNTDYTVTATEGACSSTAVVSVTTIPLPTPPTATNSNQCGFGIPSCSVSGSGGLFYWYDAPTGGTLIQSGIDDHLLTYSISSTTSFWVSEFDGTCESPRTEVIAVVGAADAIDATASSPTCANSDLTLTATNITMGGNTYTYTWTATPAAGSGIPTSVVGDVVVVQPTAGGTYTYSVTGVDGLCTAVASVTTTVTEAPQISSATASPNPACAGSDVTLTAVTGASAPVLLRLVQVPLLTPVRMPVTSCLHLVSGIPDLVTNTWYWLPNLPVPGLLPVT